MGAHEFATFLVTIACHVFGRRRVVKVSRFILRRARLDVPNRMATNGELLIQEVAAGITECPVFFDVGANIGDWSAEALRRTNVKAIHAFEPSQYTFDVLRGRRWPTSVSLNRLALSNRSGAARLFIVHEGAGSNSLHPHPDASGNDTEEVPVSTVERYCEEHSISEIALLKIDAEGHDMAVIEGARAMIESRQIAVVQFEYNHRWIKSRRLLLDAFDLFEAAGYEIGKVTPQGVEFYPFWDYELETFVEGNYVACRPDAKARLPSVRWWKADGEPSTRARCRRTSPLILYNDYRASMRRNRPKRRATRRMIDRGQSLRPS